MKRLIVIIKILLFSSVGFGHPSVDLLSIFHKKPAYESSKSAFLSPQIIKAISGNPNFTISNRNYILTYQSFTHYLNAYPIFNNGKLYMLPDDEDNGGK
jgi:hypothetical protein